MEKFILLADTCPWDGWSTTIRRYLFVSVDMYSIHARNALSMGNICQYFIRRRPDILPLAPPLLKCNPKGTVLEEFYIIFGAAEVSGMGKRMK